MVLLCVLIPQTEPTKMLRLVTVALFFGLAYASGNKAVVYLFDPSGKNEVTGEVTFERDADGIHIVGQVRGLSPGLHGFHVHKLGHIGPGCVSAGPHFNPYNQTHGAPADEKRHVGDLGNIEANHEGVAKIDFYDTVIGLAGTVDIIGRSIVVHAGEDDLGQGGNEESLKTGNAGARVACGVIGILYKETMNSEAVTLRATYLIVATLTLLRFIH